MLLLSNGKRHFNVACFPFSWAIVYNALHNHAYRLCLFLSHFENAENCSYMHKYLANSVNARIVDNGNVPVKCPCYP